MKIVGGNNMNNLILIYLSILALGCMISGTVAYIHAGKIKKRRENKQ